MQKSYFIVTAKCGHVGKNNYIEIDFPVFSTDGKAAAQHVKELPRVKHDHKDVIINVVAVDYERYYEQLNINRQDPYLNVTNKQDQKRLIPSLHKRVKREPIQEVVNHTKAKRVQRINYLKKKYKTEKRQALAYW